MKLGVVGLNSLIFLELSAGSRFDLRDAAELVVRHPELDRAEFSKLAERLGLGEAFARVGHSGGFSVSTSAAPQSRPSIASTK